MPDPSKTYSWQEVQRFNESAPGRYEWCEVTTITDTSRMFILAAVNGA